MLVFLVGLFGIAGAIRSGNTRKDRVMGRESVLVDAKAAGPISGYRYAVTNGSSWDEFLGIPYAAQPVGELRWKPPQAHPVFEKPFNASEFGPACPQHCEDEPHVCPPPGFLSEACLFLNVFRPVPKKDENSSLPVYVWFPGGNFDVESAGELLYSGFKLSPEQDMVVVTVSYRIGALGFALLADTMATDENEVSGAKTLVEGNFGVQDQVAALEWVQANIGSFGGDAGRVTIGGQSAGGSSVATLLTATPLRSKALFHRVIQESNPLSLFFKNRTETHDHTLHLANLTDCVRTTASDTLKCMSALSWESIVAVQMKTPSYGVGNGAGSSLISQVYKYSPAVGTPFLEDQPLLLVEQGKVAPSVEAVMLGTTRDEAVQWIYEPFATPINIIEFAAIADVIFGSYSSNVTSLYPVPTSQWNDTRPTMSVIGTDYVFHCPNRRMARALESAAKLPTYLYRFDHVLSYIPWGPNFTWCDDKVCHGAEIPGEFGTDVLFFQPTSDEIRLDQQLRSYWGNFIHGRTTNGAIPGNDTAPDWPRYRQDNQTLFFLTPTIQLQSNVLHTLCDFWDIPGYGKF